MTRDELIEELRKRSAACREIPRQAGDTLAIARLLGKVSAYSHAAELAEQLDAPPAMTRVQPVASGWHGEPSETDEQRRERFEAWLWQFALGKMDEHEREAIANASDEKRAEAKSKLFARGDDGEYEQVDLEQSWIFWQAALTWRGETKGGEA